MSSKLLENYGKIDEYGNITLNDNKNKRPCKCKCIMVALSILVIIITAAFVVGFYSNRSYHAKKESDMNFESGLHKNVPDVIIGMNSINRDNSPCDPHSGLDDRHRSASNKSWKLSKCIQDPIILPWDYDSIKQVYHAKLHVQPKYFTFDEHPNGERPCNFWSRTHEKLFPSPTMEMYAGKVYNLEIINLLRKNKPSDPGTNNEFRHPNTTNIHLHGLHISGEPPGDNLVRITINPGETFLYQYYLPCNQVAGTNWYHAHYHGSSALQVGAGMAGMLITKHENERSNNPENKPEWLLNIPEKFIQIHRVNLHDQGKNLENFNPDLDDLSRYDDDGVCIEEFWLVNGEYQPTLCINNDMYYNLRISHVDTDYHIGLYIERVSNGGGNCELYLIAKDGVTLNDEYPRKISHLFFTLATRTDIAIKCNAGEYIIRERNHMKRKGRDGTVIAMIDAYDMNNNDKNVDIFSEPLNMIKRPNYLENLIDLDRSEFNQYRMLMRRDTGVNGQLFESKIYETILEVNKLHEWEIKAECDDPHPYHQHINHFQLIKCQNNNNLGFNQKELPSNWIIEGDWHDVMIDDGCIRYQTDLFGGDMLFHCHKLNHEDKGLMAQNIICGGCNFDFTNFDNPNICNDNTYKPKPCLYTKYNNYCGNGNPGEFGYKKYS